MTAMQQIDHTIVARLLTSGAARWEPATNEFCFDGLRHSTKLDEFGVPILTPYLRNCIAEKEQK